MLSPNQFGGTDARSTIETPIFDFGADLRLAARVVNRLADDGMSRVFLLTPPRVVAKPELR